MGARAGGQHANANRALDSPQITTKPASVLEPYSMLRTSAIRLGLLGALAAIWSLAPRAQSVPAAELRWFKGNLHTHTINSDGDSAPDAVARWYKERRYNFLALTDHNYFTDPQGLNEFLGARDRFLLITGEEVTSSFESKPIHINAFRLRETLQPAFGPSLIETIQRNVDLIRGHGALPSLNHPNFGWAVTPDELARVRDLKLFEVYNGHPGTNDFGGGGAPGLEEAWDHVLTAGRRTWGIAVDDAHSFKEFSPTLSNPGRGWIQVRARELSESALLAAVEAGDFYSSTGVELVDVSRANKRLALEIRPSGRTKYAIEFIGASGEKLGQSFDLKAEYTLKAGEAYVRARVLDSNGLMAWTQPVFAD